MSPEVNSVVIDLRKALGSLLGDEDADAAERYTKRSIYRVPSHVKEVNPTAYCPRVVSFGPYHHGEEHLKAMEDHKLRALSHFIEKWRGVDVLVKALAEEVDNIMVCYDQLDQKWYDDKEAFLRLMILDGCFMLEILRVWTRPQGSSFSSAMLAGYCGDYWSDDDPIFSEHGKLRIMPDVLRDMLMLENQLPMLVLQVLLAAVGLTSKGEPGFINELMLKFFDHVPASAGKASSMVMEDTHLHLLDVYRKSILRLKDRPPRCGRSISCIEMVRPEAPWQKLEAGFKYDVNEPLRIRSAAELQDSGIKFKISSSRNRKRCWMGMNEITFRKGVLILPSLHVDFATESKFLNLMAFERLHVGAGTDVSSYLRFMDDIINTEMDVALLHSNGLLYQSIGGDKAVAKLFNSLPKDVVLDPDSSIHMVYHQLSSYCKKCHRRWRANLCRTYFRNPWTAISFFAAILLLTLTSIQTGYVVLQLYKSYM